MISDDFPPAGHGGTARSVDALCLGLTSRGLQIDVLTWAVSRGGNDKYPTVEARDDITVLRCDYTTDFMKNIVSLLEQRSYDLVHVHGRGFADLAYVLKQCFKKPLIYTCRTNCHVEVRLGTRGFNAERLRKQDVLLACCDIVTVCSKSEANTLMSDYPHYCAKVRVIRNPLHPMMPGLCRLDLSESNEMDPPRVLYVGRFLAKKGLTYLLDAVPLIWLQAPDTEFIFVGGYGNPNIEERILELAKTHPNRVNVVSWLDDAQLRHWYITAHILVIPSLYEPFGMVALEGMASGCAIVVSDTGGLREIMHDQVTGLVVAPADANAIASAVTRLLADTELRQTIVRNAFHHVYQQYNWQIIADEFLRLYHSLQER